MGIRTWIGTMSSARSVDSFVAAKLCRIPLLLEYGSSEAYFPLARSSEQTILFATAHNISNLASISADKRCPDLSIDYLLAVSIWMVVS